MYLSELFKDRLNRIGLKKLKDKSTLYSNCYQIVNIQIQELGLGEVWKNNSKMNYWLLEYQMTNYGVKGEKPKWKYNGIVDFG